MSDKRILETLLNLSEYCKEIDNCSKCKFGLNEQFHGHVCGIVALCDIGTCAPGEWNFLEIRRVLNKLGG